MKTQARESGRAVSLRALLAVATILLLYPAWAADPVKPHKTLPLPGEVFDVEGHTAFVILPAAENRHPNRPVPWVWYAPTLPHLPEARESWMFERFQADGIAIAGVDVGESYGSPEGRGCYSALYRELVERRGFSRKPCLLARSRGGLMLYNWAAEHAESVGGIAGIYPVCNLRSWPGVEKACAAYGLTAAQLDEQLVHHNPIDRLAPLAKAGVPIFHIHGDADSLVPLADHSEALARRYRELGGSMRLRIPPGQGHNVWDGFFECEDLVEFVVAQASPAALREPSPTRFMNPPMDARPGAFWDWLNGNIDLAQITRELDEMKAKGMSGAEIWDIGVISPDPDEPLPAGPAFLGPESLKAIHHAIGEADRLGLRLGLVASSSWNAGGSWIQPRDAMKGLYHSEVTVNGPTRLSRVLPFPTSRAPKGTNGLPIYYKEIAVLAFPQTTNKIIRDANAVINLSANTDGDGRLTWDVPAGSWVIARFITSNTGQKLMVPSPNSNGLLIDHLDAHAAETHFRHIIDQLLKMRPSLDALRYMEVDSVEVSNQTDWTDLFVEEFQRRRGYDPIPYLPVLKGSSFADPQVTSRFQHDYRKTVSDLWIDGHYRASTRFLNTYGMQLVAEAGHGGYPRAEPLRACGAVDVPRGEFWNGAQFWVVKEAASAAHIYGRQIVDAESFTGWRHWQDGPLEYKRLADTAFCDGLNRITFHTFAHTPPRGGVPGHMYHAGEHFNLNSTWWPQAGPMLSYFSRCCYLLQQGLPVADVGFYYGDDAPNLVATRRIGPDSKRLDGATCAHCGRPNPAPADALGAGYDYDVLDSDVIQNRMELKEGRLVLPHGVNYAVIVLPDRPDIPLPVLEKLEVLVLDGATLLGPKPSRNTSLADYPRCDEQVQKIAGRMWGADDGEGERHHRYGKGWVVADRNRVRETLQALGIGPDFAYTSPGKPVDLDYIHRRTLDADIYFVSNTRMEETEADCVFRVPRRGAQLWFPDTGEIQSCLDAESVAGGVKLRLRLPPAGSVFVVFGATAAPTLPTTLPRARTDVRGVFEIPGPWEVRFPPNLGAPPSRVFEELVSWTTVPDDGIKYFSGTATYLKQFDVEASMLAHGDHLELDLGQLRNVAEATLNDQPLGIRWKPPFSYDVTGLVRPGKNRLAVKITNLWANRLAGDAQLPRDKRITRITQKVGLGGPLEAGLFGPVRLRVVSNDGSASARPVNRPNGLDAGK
ncbi:MAG TPA: glycosyl hydrolase [Candidatus Paceibacterota bacterium]|nr:glycosyl hydrolase [Candidatus Paceibacterota bacterium]